MSIIPVLINLARGLEEDYSPVDDDFGFGIYPGDIFRPRSSNSLLLHPGHRFNPYERRICRRRRESSGNDVLNGKIAKPSVGKDGFQVCMDVSHFKPNELTVKTVDNKIVVEGNHEEREDDHGFVTRKFTRKYILPKGFDAKDVVSTMSSDGVLTIKAPPLPKSSKSNERIIQIQQTGPAHLCVKDNNQTDGDSVKNGSEKIDARSK